MKSNRLSNSIITPSCDWLGSVLADRGEVAARHLAKPCRAPSISALNIRPSRSRAPLLNCFQRADGRYPEGVGSGWAVVPDRYAATVNLCPNNAQGPLRLGGFTRGAICLFLASFLLNKRRNSTPQVAIVGIWIALILLGVIGLAIAVAYNPGPVSYNRAVTSLFWLLICAIATVYVLRSKRVNATYRTTQATGFLVSLRPGCPFPPNCCQYQQRFTTLIC
jgi:hypothetical protein